MPTTTAVTNRVTANTDQIEGVDATDQIRDAILDDATRFSGADIDQALSTTEGNIRGADSDTLKTLSDQLDGVSADSIWNEIIEAGAPSKAQTARQMLRIVLAALAGEDGETGDWSAKSLDGTKVRLAGTLSASGARESVDTLDGS